MEPLADLTERMPAGAVSTDPAELRMRARDLWALALLRETRGEAVPSPSGVVFPSSTQEVSAVMAWAAETNTAVVPRGGGSGVCGGAQAVDGSVVLDLSRMDRILSLDRVSLAVEVEAGTRGGELEAFLERHGLTSGHYPQSIDISTVGGWIAASSAGQGSAAYGAIEDLLLGATVVLAGGEVLRLRPVPRSGAGPDLRKVFVGSEGTLGVVTEAILSCSRRPDAYAWEAFSLDTFGRVIDLGRTVAQGDTRPLFLRGYDPVDSALSFGSLGHSGGCVAIVGYDGQASGLEGRLAALRLAAERAGAEPLGAAYGEHWWRHRNDAVDTYRRIMGQERMFGSGVIVDTLELAGLWARLPELYEAVRAALLSHAEVAGCHLSHQYRSGASLYFTFLIRAGDDREAEEAYLAAWGDGLSACLDGGGTLTHHHGVGVLKAPFMERELGEAGVAVLRRLKAGLDPSELLNPGKLLP